MVNPTELNIENEAAEAVDSTTTTEIAPAINDQVEKAATIDGKEATVEGANLNTHSQVLGRVPKVTFCCQEMLSYRKPGPWHYAKIFLPKSHKDAMVAAIKCFGSLLTYPNYPEEISGFTLNASIRKHGDTGFAWAYILEDEWWEIMKELIEEDPNLEVAVIPYKK